MRKSLLSVLLTALILCSTMFISAFGAETPIIYGDVDSSGSITVLDATCIQMHCCELLTINSDRIVSADVDGNNDVSIIDATIIQRFLAEMIDKFPVEEDAPVTPTTPQETINKIDPVIDVYFSNNRNWKNCYAYVYNQDTGENTSTWPGILLTDSTTNTYGETVFTFKADTSKYNRVIFNNGTGQCTDTPLTVANSGYFINTMKNSRFIAGLYPYGQDKEGTIKQVNLEYSSGYNKRITIWTPVGYDASDKDKKYSVLYMTDGQNLFGNDENCSQYEWEVDETVLSYMQNGGDGIIVVGIDNANSKRDSELTPDIGDVIPKYNSGGFKNGTGKAYADFVVEKVIPYIDANYNTNSIRGIAGSSSGGIESFYIGMEHMDKFNYIGAISPAFLLYDEATWSNYLSKFDFTDESKLPRIYFFNGNSKYDSLEQELYPNAVAMQGWMEKKGYPSKLLKTVVDNDAVHNEIFWALYFPEALSFGLGY